MATIRNITVRRGNAITVIILTKAEARRIANYLANNRDQGKMSILCCEYWEYSYLNLTLSVDYNLSSNLWNLTDPTKLARQALRRTQELLRQLDRA